MKRLILLLLTAMVSVLCSAQLSTIFVTLVDPPKDQTPNCVVNVWKQMPDSTYKVKTKGFSKQAMIALDPGTYIFSFRVDQRVIHNEKLVLLPYESCIVFNLYLTPVRLVDADFSQIIFATPGMLSLVSKRLIYMDF